MIRTGIALIEFYAAHPSALLRHARKAAHILRTGGVGQLLTLVRSRAVAMGEELEERSSERVAQVRLLGMPQAQTTNAEILVSALLPFADDLSVLDIIHDTHERLRLISCHILKKNRLLDEEFYRRAYLEGVNSITPADHYMQFGLVAGLRPNAWFDPIEYLSAYPDIADVGMDPVIHYALFGWREGRSAGSLFDGDFYLAANPDVAQAGISPMIHFLNFGRHEKRLPRRPNSDIVLGVSDSLRKSGTIVIVSHDAELGGAQQVARVFAKWLLSTTRYDVKLVTMRGGAFAASFDEIAPTFDVSAHPAAEVSDRLTAFAGTDVKAIFINSVASGGFLRHWREDTPVVAFIHELPKLLLHFSDNLDLIKKRARTIVGGSEAVRTALRDGFGIDEARLRTVYGFIESLPPDGLVAFEEKRAAKEALGLDPNTFLVTACGVLHWRKSPDKFIQVAQKIVGENGPAAQFVWIGGGPDKELCERMVVDKGLTGVVRFTGYEPNIMRWLNASDLFLLPSEEDPFPLVCLYAAMALNPIICFEKAGGMPEFVARGCGRAVPFGNVEAMAKALRDYLKHGKKRQREALAGRALVEEEHTVGVTGPQLLHHIREAAALKPHASVVVPNYNYERFLDERLSSIARQTFQDFEVILLDDKSSDGSVAVLKEWAKHRPGTRVLVSDKNSGSPFAQWMRGMRLARSDVIWIAEADDSCRPEFLETLLPYFDDRNVFLGYTKSIPVDEAGREAGDYEALYLNRIAEGRWSRPYVVSDHEEANEGLGIANCIPNASSVIFRRFEPEPEFEQAVTSMRMCGDWMFYLRAMRGGLVAYDNKALNLHRRHGGTVTAKTEGSLRYFDEFTTIRSYVARTYRLTEYSKTKIQTFTLQDLDRFGIGDPKERARVLEPLSTGPNEKGLPSVLFVVSDLSPGGGQMFAIRIANAWMHRGGRAVLFNVRQYPDHDKVLSKIDSRVAVFHNGAFGPSLPELVEQFDIDVVHSALWWADRHVQENARSLPDVAWVLTMHGCYETILSRPEIDLSFGARIQHMLSRVDEWVPTADKNRRVFAVYGKPKAERRIVNGVELEPGEPLSREKLGLRPASVVICLASRAIAEKGWFSAVEMTERLNRTGHEIDLMLIGEGPAADEIGALAPDHVHLYGHVDNLQDYIETADIGILPSYFVGESMPLVLLEMMARCKPVVATNVGEIPAMLGEGDEAGGIVVPLRKGVTDVDEFVEAITILLNTDRREEMGRRARQRFEMSYTTKQMIENYEQLYRDVIAEKTSRHRRLV